MAVQVSITNWAFWCGSNDHANLKYGTPGLLQSSKTGIGKADLASGLKPAWKRRLDLYGRAAAEVLATTLRTDDNPYIVFASRHGNIERTVELLHQVITDEALSPADFGMSVHNALVGIASINWSITESHTAVAAGPDSLVAGMTEAICQINDTNLPVILCYIDLPLPDVYRLLEQDAQTGTALAVRFEPLLNASQANSYTAEFGPTSKTPRVSAPLEAERFAKFLESGPSNHTLAGTNGCWTVSKNA
ncbi:beta-ketoacyl synthase chain length factor [Thalassospira tepidiphila]|uniref:beta-ketoacyl synthase chain length factor n=1 Tax=Thalassospira tepidiphila TaxID=393657 RepID=UPI00291DB929|nr:hypothetical protein MACH01_17500 [Thalassospira tepidiphila]